MTHRSFRRTGAWTARLAGLAVVCAVGILTHTDQVSAQTPSGPTNPTKTKVSKQPYVLMVMDSSASMEWTQEGPSQYPFRAYDAFNLDDPYPTQPSSYRPGQPLGVDDGGEAAGDYNSSSNPLMFGSCFVWEPPCSGYERPSWKISNTWTSQYGNSSGMGGRLRDWRYMRGDSSYWSAPDGSTDTLGFPVRLLNHNQPRHVTFKEVLTGEMVFVPDDKKGQTISSMNFQRYGPGCWFVPRQRGAAHVDDPVCCQTTKTVTQPDGSKETICDVGYNQFEQYPDHRDPRPHLQEVYDAQVGNGLIDNLNEQIHFAVTSFDSYKFPMDGQVHSSDPKPPDDSEDTVLWRPHSTSPFELSDPYDSSRSIESNTADDYNLGAYRIVGPTDFPSTKNDMKQINRMTQMALKDSGTLKAEAYQSSKQLTENPDFVHNPKVGTYANSVLLGRQPVSRNTPLAPAVHDVHDYFRDSQGPISDDRFKACRPKHVIMMTDGMPRPEAPSSGTRCVDVGQEALSEGFAIDKNEYDYKCTEETITDFVSDSNINVNDARYDPRVHVVGINQRDWTESQQKPTAVKKLASMAVAGKTCAGWYLGNRTESQEDECGVVGSSTSKGPWIPDFDGNSSDGYCRKPDHPCLIKQYSKSNAPKSFVSFGAPSRCPPPGGWTQGCQYPAIILTCNTIKENEAYYNQSQNSIPSGYSNAKEAARAAYRECRSGKWSAEALQQIFNSILESSGLASRTRAAVTNELDDPDQKQSGQYRFYSGVRVQPGQSVWRGVMFRERRMCTSNTGVEQIQASDKKDPCSSSNNTYDCFHEEIGDQIERDNNEVATKENRRIFTTAPTTDAFSYETGEGRSSTAGSCKMFHSTYMTQEAPDRGEFQASYLHDASSSDKSAQLLDQRIPFTKRTLKEALVGKSNSDDDRPIGDPDPDSDADVSDDASLHSYFNTTSTSELIDLIKSIRAHPPGRDKSALAGILNSSPVTVPPPQLDVPMESYRAYKERFENRATMMYFATLDGMLHAVHTGELDGGKGNPQRVRVRDNMDVGSNSDFKNDPYSSLSSSTGTAKEQREAWSYIPHMLHDNLAKYQGVNPNLMDGTPEVKSVRLCDADLSKNQNFQACRILCDGGRDPGSICTGQSNNNQNNQNLCVPKALQWRTVLVQGLGQAGSGYFALDITRPGGPAPSTVSDSPPKPDPIPLWEFDSSWEKGQIQHMINNDSRFENTGENLVFPPKKERGNQKPSSTSCGDTEYWKQPFLGQSISEPAIGTVILPPLEKGSDPLRRPVAVFGGGAFGPYGTSKCDPDSRVGKAVYVVDMQTGSILRRFTGYRDPRDGKWKKFDAPIVGSPALFNDQPGRLASRGFVGDEKGRMFRIEFSGDPQSTPRESWNPGNWELSLFFDPTDSSNCSLSGKPGAAHLRPAVARNTAGNPVVVYGLGNPGDIPSKTDAHTVLAVEEKIGTRKDDDLGTCIWHVSQGQPNGLRKNEKLTGEPVIFNNAAYFTTFYLDKQDVCKKGNSRIWGVRFGVSNQGDLPKGVFDCKNNSKLAKLNECQPRYFEPNEDTVVRGLTITLGPACNASPGTDSTARLQEGNDQEPQLIVQTGSAEPGTSSGGGGGGGGGGSAGNSDFVHRMSVGLTDEYRRTVPMSWSVVN